MIVAWFAVGWKDQGLIDPGEWMDREPDGWGNDPKSNQIKSVDARLQEEDDNNTYSE